MRTLWCCFDRTATCPRSGTLLLLPTLLIKAGNQIKAASTVGLIFLVLQTLVLLWLERWVWRWWAAA